MKSRPQSGGEDTLPGFDSCLENIKGERWAGLLLGAEEGSHGRAGRACTQESAGGRNTGGPPRVKLRSPPALFPGAPRGASAARQRAAGCP